MDQARDITPNSPRARSEPLASRSVLHAPTADIVLAIETSNPSAWTPQSTWRPGIALARLALRDPSQVGPQPLAISLLTIEPLVLDDPHHDDLMGAIDRACARAGVSPRNLACVGVSVGPGGFTSVRVAVTCAKMICEATGAACVPLPTSDVIAASAHDAMPDGPRRFAVALASKASGDGAAQSGGDAYVALYERPAKGPWEPAPIEPPRVRDAKDLARLLPGLDLLIADRFLPASLRAAIEPTPIEGPSLDPVACARLAALRMARDTIDPAALLPIYPREPEAVTKWRKARGATREA